MPRILLVEDDPAIREGLELALGRRGHEVQSVSSGEDGIEAISTFHPDLVLLDLMLPGMNGIQVCRKVRKTSRVPIIMLTARTDDFDIVIGLEAGADDYILKPARTAVIDARIRAVLRRVEGRDPSAGEVHGDLIIDRPKLTVSKSGQRLHLTASELNLLLHLSASPEQTFSRQQLLEQVWKHSYLGDLRLVDAGIRRLRTKVEDMPGRPQYIQTVRGRGYRFGPV
ncbi:response regulator [Streptomyces vinaceus]|uniref:response regulator n=1 Tax=Streptomyces vinaceus TaxID=1960 RepID=UPI0035D56A39